VALCQWLLQSVQKKHGGGRVEFRASGNEDKEAEMPEYGDFMDLIKEGKLEEARALIERQKVKMKYAPDTISVVNGKPPRLTKKGKLVELGEDGNWRLKPKAVTP